MRSLLLGTGAGHRLPLHGLPFIAGQFAVTGYVKNLPDGRVELVVEGRPQEMGDALRRPDRDGAAIFATFRRRPARATGRFSSFDVRF